MNSILGEETKQTRGNGILLAKVFNIKGTKEMTELLVAKNLSSEICPS